MCKVKLTHMRNEPLRYEMVDVNASTRTQRIHQTHPLHNNIDANMNYKFTHGGASAPAYSDLFIKHGLPINPCTGGPDERHLFATKHPLARTTQTGVGHAELVQYWSQHPNPSILTQANGHRHSVESQSSSSSSSIKQSQLLPYLWSPGGLYPFFPTLPSTRSGSTGGNAMKTTRQTQRGTVKRNRSQPVDGNQLWNTEWQPKRLRVGKTNPPPPHVTNNKSHSFTDRKVQPISKDHVTTSRQTYGRQRQADYVNEIGCGLGGVKGSHPLNRGHLNLCKCETHPRFVSTQAPLPKDTVTKNGMLPNISTSIASTMQPLGTLVNTKTPQVAKNKQQVSPQRKQSRVYFKKGKGYSPDNVTVRAGVNSTPIKNGKHLMQYKGNTPTINPKSGLMNNSMKQVHPVIHPYTVRQPYSDNSYLMYYDQTFSKEPGGLSKLKGVSHPQLPQRTDSLHLVNPKLVDTSQRHRENVLLSLHYELQCKRMAIRQQKSKNFVARHSASNEVTPCPSTPVKGIQNERKSLNLVHPHFASSNQGGFCTIPKSTVDNVPHINQTGIIAQLKLRQDNSSSADTNTFASKRLNPFKDFRNINDYQSWKGVTNAEYKRGERTSHCEWDFKCLSPDAVHEIHDNYHMRGINTVKDRDRKMPARGMDGSIKTKTTSGGDANTRQGTKTTPKTKLVESPDSYVSEMTYGKFLQDIVVPMTLAVSNKDTRNHEQFTSLLKLWRSETNHFQTECTPVNESSRRKLTKRVIDRAHSPIKAPNLSFLSDKPKRVTEVEDMGRGLLSEESCKGKGPSKGGSEHEKETKETHKVAIRENLTAVEAQSTSYWDEQITSSTSDVGTNETTDIMRGSYSLKEKHPTEESDEVSSSTSVTPRMRSVRVVLRSSDRIRMKFYNVDSSQTEQPEKVKRKRGRERKGKRRKNMKKKTILMRIGSEKLFTRCLYYSSISPKKSTPPQRKKEAKEKRRKLPPPPKDFNRIALSVHKHSGETILHRVVRVDAKEVFLYCLENNVCEINAKDNAGYTALHECCVFDKVWMAEKLILHGADVNTSANDGTRPIHDAVENQRAEMTRLLLSHGADPLLPTYAKRTALDNATSPEITTLLHDYLKDMNGESEELFSKLKLPNVNRRTIRFKSSLSMQEDEQWTDNFLDTSDLNETAEEHRDAILYVKEIQQPKHIRLQLRENEKIKTWYLLSDVLARLKIPAATFPYLYPHIKVNALPTSIFMKKIERVAGLNQFDFTAICGKRELVEFVEADDEMCSILQFESWNP